MKKKIVIIGAGEIGSALNFLAQKAGRSVVSMWDADERKVAGQQPLEKTVPEADTIFLGVPSKAVRSCLKNIRPLLKERALVISLAKGIEEGTLETMDEVLRDEIGAKKSALLFGPMIAEELREGRSGAAVLACKTKQALSHASNIFNRGDLRIEFSRDLRGVALAGVLKNIYSLGLGIIHGLNLGTNYRGWYVGQACGEMSLIIKKMKGKKETVYGPAGIGDLVATGFSSDSKNHQVGREMAVSGETIMTSEGSDSLPRICRLLGDNANQYLLLSALSDIFIKKKPVKNYFPEVIGD